MLACIARGSDGHWIGAMESGVFTLTPQADGRLSTRLLSSVKHAQAGMRFNDGRCSCMAAACVPAMAAMPASPAPEAATMIPASGRA